MGLSDETIGRILRATLFLSLLPGCWFSAFMTLAGVAGLSGASGVLWAVPVAAALDAVLVWALDRLSRRFPDETARDAEGHHQTKPST